MPTFFLYLFIIYFLKCWDRLIEPKLFTFYFAIHWIKAENKNKRELKKIPDIQLFTFYFAILLRQTGNKNKRAKKNRKKYLHFILRTENKNKKVLKKQT
jgi:hypothetical protein